MLMDIKNNGSWILRSILQIRPDAKRLTQWDSLKRSEKFRLNKAYIEFLKEIPNVVWSGLVRSNIARPRAVFLLWLACHKRLPTKDRLMKIDIFHQPNCIFCNCAESVQHLFFECNVTSVVWEGVLRSKNLRGQFLKIAVAKTIYEIGWNRNRIVYNKNYTIRNTVNVIVDNIVNRVWVFPKYRHRIVQILLS
ncbi:unnamed protein product [Vicia faba]|uniref:Reverse transcriptase zinc-binding domain-containing protein n=1 Tax=Vicia faba TaxID=3906 RepID=A0AAV0Z4R4_VICFA|nr:unnamed protein product [Vicia faba]